MTTEHVSVPRELFDMAREQIERQRLAALEYGLIAVAEAHSYALHKIDAILSRATPSDVKVPEKLQFNAGDSHFIVQRKEGWNDCIEKMIGSDSQRFALDQSFVDRVTQGDDESPDVIGAGCADSIKRVAEEMVHACKAVLQGDAEFTHDAVDDWAHRIMCFADYVPRKPSAPRVVTADVVDRITEVLRHHRLTHSQDDDGEGYPLIDALSIGHKTVKEGIEEIEYLADAIAGELSFATSPPAARVPDGFIELLARAEDVANVDWTHMESGSWQKMRGLRTAIGMAKMSMFAAAPQAGES